MKNQFPIDALVRASRSLPMGSDEQQLVVDDFGLTAQIVQEGMVSEQAGMFLDTYGPIMDAHMNLSSIPKGMQPTYRLACATMLHNTLRNTTQREATMASTSLPTFTRQKLMTVMRLFPALRAPQLFGFLPMAGPTARIQFLKYTYGDNYVNSAPTIAVGDGIDDPTKQNPGFVAHTEGTAAKTVSFQYLKLDISASDRRVVGDWSDRLADETAAVYGGNAESMHLDICARLLGQSVDRDMINAALAAVPSANTLTYAAKPSGYGSLVPSEKMVEDANLFNNGVVPLLEQIRVTCRFAPEGQPNWAICDPNASLLLRKIQGFTANEVDVDQIRVDSGPVEIGRINDYGIRIYVDAAFNIGNSAQGKILFGRRPASAGEAGIYLGMWIPAKITERTYNAQTGQNVRGIRSSYAIAAPNTSTEPESAQLARSYGLLTITLAQQ